MPVLSFIKRRSSEDHLFFGIISSMSCDITKAEFSLYNAHQKTVFFPNLVGRFAGGVIKGTLLKCL